MKQPTSTQRLIGLVLISSVIAVAAFVVLLWLATLPAVQARIDFNDDRKINGGATFYTDHEFLTDLLLAKESKRD